MIFPLSIQFKKKVANKHLVLTSVIILKYIRMRFERLGISEFTRFEDKVVFKNKLFNGRGRYHIFAHIDSGSFEYKIASHTILYTFSMQRRIMIIGAISLILFIISFQWLLATAIFFGNLGISILVSFIRLSTLTKELKEEINKLHYSLASDQ